MRVVLCVVLSCICQEVFAQASGSVRFLGQYIPPSGGAYTAGCWGWTDPATGREYALLGNQSGTAIVELTKTGQLIERDFIPGVSSGWREIQTHSHYAYVVSEGGGGTQIIDLSYLPDSAHLVKNFTWIAGSRNTSRAHTIQIDNGYMYLNGCANWPPGGIVIFNLANPTTPTVESSFNRVYVHDSYVRNDTIYAAAIYGVGVDIIDARDKRNLRHLYTLSYPNAGTHNCAITTDGRFLLTTDEINHPRKSLKIWSLEYAPEFPMVAEYIGDPTAIVHNVFVKGKLAIMSYYTAGMKVVDISDPTNPREIGGYDTYPGTGSAYTGAWSVYPYFPSGRIVIGDMVSGMYVVNIIPGKPLPVTNLSTTSDSNTLSSIALSWIDPTEDTLGVKLYNYKIDVYRDGEFIAIVDSGSQALNDAGLIPHKLYHYSLRVRNVTTGHLSNTMTISAFAGGVLNSYSNNFESGPGTLIRTGSWDITSQGFSGDFSLSDSPVGNYADGSETYFQTPPVYGLEWTMVEFVHAAIVAPDDSAVVEVSTDGGETFSILKTFRMTDRPGWEDGLNHPEDWILERIDLSAFAGNPVVVRFRLWSDGANTADGWYIDDIFVGSSVIPATADQSIAEGWNLISIPLLIPETNRSTIYTNSISRAFSFQGRYVATDSLITGVGYWIKFDSTRMLELAGSRLLKRHIPVTAGWNIIGSLTEPVNIATVETEPSGIIASPLYAYQGGYTPSAVVEPGRGYWVRTSQSGLIKLSSFSGPLAPAKNGIPSEDRSVGVTNLTFKDRKGRQQTLFLAAKPTGPREWFSLPPFPPDGAFDVRYSSDRLVEYLDGGQDSRFPIRLQAGEYPMTIEWEIHGPVSHIQLVVDDLPIALSGTGTTQIQLPISSIEIRSGTGLGVDNLPTEFSLSPAYPNPFNPRTEFQYAVAERSFVTVRIYDVLGKQLATLVEGVLERGQHRIWWDAMDIPSGVYFARFSAITSDRREVYQQTRTLMLMK